MKTIIVTAMKAESPVLGKTIRGVLIRVSGMGPEKAGESIERLIAAERPDRIILTGFCGGVDPALRPGDLCIPRDTIRGNGRESPTPGERQELIRIAESLKLHHSSGTMETFDAPVLSLEGIAPDVAAVDMESFSVVRAANRLGMPVSVIKVVSDRIPRRKPVLFARFLVLWRMARNYSKAKRRIDEVFARIVTGREA